MGPLGLETVVIPDMNETLLSVFQICNGGTQDFQCISVFSPEECRIFKFDSVREALKLMHETGVEIMRGTCKHGLYHEDKNFKCNDITGVLPNISNLKYKNSFTDEFIDEATNTTKKYHYVITNAKEKLEKSESDKTKVSISTCSGRIQKFAIDNSLNGKEACSLMLMMDLLEVGGTSIGVLKEGMFFNSAYKNVRKCLIENFNVREVISVPQDQFENTSTKTSIVIFDNKESKTTEVRFSKLLVNKYEKDVDDDINGSIYLVENKGDIKELSEVIVSVATSTELLNNGTYSLNGNDYNKEVMDVGEGYEIVKLGNVCEFHKYKDVKLDNS